MRMLALLAGLTLAAACSTAKPVADTSKPVPGDTVTETPTSPLPPSPAELRTPPETSAFFGEDYTATILDLGTGWLLAGVKTDDGTGVRMVWVADGAEPEIKEAAVPREEHYCNQGASTGLRVELGHLLLNVECIGGEDDLVTADDLYVFGMPEHPEKLGQFELVWSGRQDWMHSSQLDGCADGDGGHVEVRGNELWLTYDPWEEKSEAPESECDGADDPPPPVRILPLAP